MKSSTKDISKANEAYIKLCRVSNGIYLWIIFVVFSSIYPFLIEVKLKQNALIFASSGVLMFIAIFYSLLVSKKGDEIIEGLNEIIDCTTEELKETAKKEIDETKNLKKTISKIDDETRKLNWVKQFTRLDFFLLIAVFSFLLSIFLSLFESDKIIFYTNYLAFIGGLAFSSAIVLEWTIFYKIVRQYKFTEEKIVYA